jgi:hypothetical protein
MQGNWLGRWAGEWFGRVADAVAIVIGSKTGREQANADRPGQTSSDRQPQIYTARTAEQSAERATTEQNDRAQVVSAARVLATASTRKNKQSTRR